MNQSIHHSYWIQQRPIAQRFETLTSKVKTDVLVIGAGITGLSTAIELAQRGKRVVVCDASLIGAGTTAQARDTWMHIQRLAQKKLIAKLGLDMARLYTDTRKAAIERIREIAAGQCDWTQVKAYRYSDEANDESKLRDEMESSQRSGSMWLGPRQYLFLRAKFGYEVLGCARIDMARYLLQLTQSAVQSGVKLYENCLVKSDGKANIHSLDAGSGSVEFEHVVCATHSNFTPLLRIYAATPVTSLTS